MTIEMVNRITDLVFHLSILAASFGLMRICWIQHKAHARLVDSHIKTMEALIMLGKRVKYLEGDMNGGRTKTTESGVGRSETELH